MQDLICKMYELANIQKEWLKNNHVYYIISTDGKIGTYISSKTLKDGDIIESQKISYR